MKSRSRKAAVLVASAAILALLTGCGAASSSSNAATGYAGKCKAPAENSDATAITGTPSGTITFQTQGLKADFGEFFNPLIANFEKKYPKVTVKWTDEPGGNDAVSRMMADAQTCGLPDVLNVPGDSIFALTNAGMLMNFDKKDPSIGDGFVPSLWNSLTFNKKMGHTALPWYWGPFVTTYNKQLVKKAGLNPDEAPATFQDKIDMSIKIAKASDESIKSLWGNPAWTFVDDWHGLGVKAMNSDQTKFTFATDKNAVKWLQDYIDAYKAGAIPADSVTGAPDPGQVFNEGNLVFGTNNPSFLRNVKKNAPTLYPNVGVAPYAKNAGAKTLVSAQYLTVPQSTKHAAAAIAFAKYVTNAENELAWSKDPNVVIFPTQEKALKDPFFTTPAGDDALSKGRVIAAKEALDSEAWAPQFYLTVAQQPILKEFQLALQGNVTAQQALTTAQDEANRNLAATK